VIASATTTTSCQATTTTPRQHPCGEVRTQSATCGYGDDNEPFAGTNPHLPVVTIGSEKLQGTDLNTALTQQAGQVDNQFNSDIKAAMLEGEEVTIKATPASATIVKFDSAFDPGGAPDEKASPLEYGRYTLRVYRRR